MPIPDLLLPSAFPFLITGAIFAVFALFLVLNYEEASAVSETEASAGAGHALRWLKLSVIWICLIPSLLPASIVFSTLQNVLRDVGIFPPAFWFAGALAIIPSLPLACLVALEVFRPRERLKAARAVAVNVPPGEAIATLSVFAAFFAKPFISLVLIHFMIAHFHLSVASQTGILTVGSYMYATLGGGAVPNSIRLGFIILIIVFVMLVLLLPRIAGWIARRFMMFRLKTRAGRPFHKVDRRTLDFYRVGSRSVIVSGAAVFGGIFIVVLLRLLGILTIGNDGAGTPWSEAAFRDALRSLSSVSWWGYAFCASAGSLVIVMLAPKWMKKNFTRASEDGLGIKFVSIAAVAFCPSMAYGLLGLFLLDLVASFSYGFQVYIHLLAFVIGLALACSLGFRSLFGAADVRVLNASLLNEGMARVMKVAWLSGLQRIFPMLVVSAYIVWIEDGLRRAFGRSTFAAHFYNQQGGYSPELRLEAVLAGLVWLSLMMMFVTISRGVTRAVTNDGAYCEAQKRKLY